MDPISQGVLGAALPLSMRRTSDARMAGVMGLLAGMAPDLDVFIRSSTDSLLFLEYHRQFTHSLIFVPLGSFAVAATIYGMMRPWRQSDFRTLWLFAALGFATHGLLDAATSYGTQLLWPISDVRFSISIVPIVDPLFSLPLLVFVIVGMWRRNGRWAVVGLIWVVAYLGAGALQHQEAKSIAAALAAERGHTVSRIEVKPTFANILLWKSIYEAGDRFYIDAIRPRAGARAFEGKVIEKLDPVRDFPWLDLDSQQARDIERFDRLSDGFVAKAADGSERVIDVRYSFLPNEIDPLWSVRLDPNADPASHVAFETHRGEAREKLNALLEMVLGE